MTTPETHSAILPSKWRWLLCAIPQLVIWGLCWLVYYPAIMSYDSILQWGQLVTGRFDDVHPVFHTLLLWIVTRPWPSPAAVALFQVILMALVTGYAVWTLRGPRTRWWHLWLAGAFLALLPINLTFVITLWKDVPYTAAFLGLVLILSRVQATRGATLTPRYSWLLGGLAALLPLLRHNGLTVGFGALLLLVLFYPAHWKGLIVAFLIGLALWAGVRGPLYRMVGVQGQGTGFYLETLLVHHIGAHLQAETPLTADERSALEGIAPLEENWNYDCASIWSTTLSPGYQGVGGAAGRQRLAEILVALARRNPLATIRHVACSGSMLWQVTDHHPSAFSGPYLPENNSGEIETIAQNPFNLRPSSRIPMLVRLLSTTIRWTIDPGRSWLFWRPALWTYLAILVTTWRSWRNRDITTLILLLPVLIQAATLLLLATTQEARLHYPIYLSSLYLILYYRFNRQ